MRHFIPFPPTSMIYSLSFVSLWSCAVHKEVIVGAMLGREMGGVAQPQWCSIEKVVTKSDAILGRTLPLFTFSNRTSYPKIRTANSPSQSCRKDTNIVNFDFQTLALVCLFYLKEGMYG